MQQGRGAISAQISFAIVTSHNHTAPFVLLGERLTDAGSGLGRAKVLQSWNLRDIPYQEPGLMFRYPIAWESAPNDRTFYGGIAVYRRGYVGELVFLREQVAQSVYDHFSAAFQLTLYGLVQRGLLKATKLSGGGIVLPSGMKSLQGG